jgi:hypothetical protein
MCHSRNNHVLLFKLNRKDYTMNLFSNNITIFNFLRPTRFMVNRMRFRKA